MRAWFVVAIFILAGTSAHAADWLFAPSDYTHNPATGKRIDQYAAIPPQYVYTQPSYSRSVYRYERSALQVGDSIDNLHIVNQSGPAFAPYRTWQLPYRPYAVPYDAWGPQVNGGGYGGYGGGYGPYGPFGPGVGPGFGGPGFGGGPWGPVDGFGGQVNPYAPGAGPWGGTYTLPRGPLDPRSGVFGPTEQQEWFDKNSHGPLINPNIPYPGQQNFFPNNKNMHHHHNGAHGPT